MTAANPTALVVDDSPEILQLVSSALRRDGFDVREAGTGDQALTLAREEEPDLVVLDLMMPGIDGIETCRRLRKFSRAYVIMLTARADEADKLVGLAIGADDYVTKSFSPRGLVARARAMLRRPRGAERETGTRAFDGLSVDVGTREVRVGGELIDLTRTEFDLLEVLTGTPRTVLTRTALVQRIWGDDWFGDDHVLDVHMSSLRRKLGDDPKEPRYVHTVRGVGYRFVGEPA
ncbi:MAG: response regulator transcription factor [Actinomycetes bacterium]